MVNLRCANIILFIISFFFHVSLAVIPVGELTTRKLKGTTTIVYVAPASFGDSLSAEKDATFMRLVKPLSGFDGCAPVPQVLKSSSFYLLVSRGNCSFADKAIAAANIGARGVVIYNSLEGIYQGNDTASSNDYECDNGSGHVSTVISPVYSDEMNDLMPESCTQDSKCSSKRCILTNVTSLELGTQVRCLLSFVLPYAIKLTCYC
jgi:hypothetical protein